MIQRKKRVKLLAVVCMLCGSNQLIAVPGASFLTRLKGIVSQAVPRGMIDDVVSDLTLKVAKGTLSTKVSDAYLRKAARHKYIDHLRTRLRQSEVLRKMFAQSGIVSTKHAARECEGILKVNMNDSLLNLAASLSDEELEFLIKYKGGELSGNEIAKKYGVPRKQVAALESSIKKKATAIFRGRTTNPPATTKQLNQKQAEVLKSWMHRIPVIVVSGALTHKISAEEFREMSILGIRVDLRELNSPDESDPFFGL